MAAMDLVQTNVVVPLADHVLACLIPVYGLAVQQRHCAAHRPVSTL
jgi:hypothetical protein